VDVLADGAWQELGQRRQDFDEGDDRGDRAGGVADQGAESVRLCWKLILSCPFSRALTYASNTTETEVLYQSHDRVST
jgi:hypothetical protein